MLQPQAGIIPEPSPSALFLILRVRDPAAISRVVIDEDGEELEIVRHSFP
jgi:hypothetical protein